MRPPLILSKHLGDYSKMQRGIQTLAPFLVSEYYLPYNSFIIVNLIFYHTKYIVGFLLHVNTTLTASTIHKHLSPHTELTLKHKIDSRASGDLTVA